MDLNEAIIHSKETAKKLRAMTSVTDGKPYDECLECAREHEQLAEWLEELVERRKADEWISIKDRLPDKNGNYLVLLNNGEMTTDIFDEEELFMGFWGYMTHWRPLPPKPYESEDK